MAISKEHHSLYLFQEAAKLIPLLGSKWAFLGNQRLRGCPRENPDPALWRAWWGFDFPDPPIKLAKSKLHSVKPWMEFFGAQCVMLDSNGKDSCLQWDLNKALPSGYHGTFDVVTNFGTSEHVVPDQMPVFQTIHDLCRPGGLMLHAVPSEGCNRHGEWRYPLDWFDHLRETQEYEIAHFGAGPVSHNRGKGPHLYAVMAFRKVKDQPWRPDYWRDPLPSER